MSYPTLLSPLRIGPLTLSNRVVSTSHQTTLVHEHLPTDDFVAYHAARAAGGVGAIFLEATAVHETGLLTGHTLGGYLPEIVDGYQRVARAVQPAGTKLLVQLFHGGREQFGGAPRAPAVAPAAVPSPRFKSEPRGLTRREIAELVAGYARAAHHAQLGGLDGVEVSMAHGYLAAQFFDPAINRRQDEYAGDLESRTRFALEVLEAIRETVGTALVVGVRLSADEMQGRQGATARGEEVRRRLESSGLIDFVSMALGHSADYRGSTYIAPPAPIPQDAIVGRLPGAGQRSLPLIATTRIVDVAHAEAILAAGHADAVGMTRALIADPDLVHKTASGREADIQACIGCNQACIGHYHAGLPIGCVVNPRTGRERRLPPVAARSGRRVLVIGAGPAGLAAAVQSARAGDRVTLLEARSQIGGQLALAGAAPAHAEVWERFRAGAERDIVHAGVQLRLGEPADPAAAGAYDRVILATGAEPYLPPIPTLGATRVTQAWEAIARPQSVTGSALIADWGGEWSGLDAAEVLAANGVAVTLACAATIPGETLHQYQRNGYLDRLDAAGVLIRHHTELALEDGVVALRHVFSGRTEPLASCDTLVLAQGRRPRDELWTALEDHPGAVRVGDVLGPRSAEEAVLEGFLAGRDQP
jgi:2,4-dienoyl-CoA reductase-like NADH-dependent reductase (Old Yellow Enzyme family)